MRGSVMAICITESPDLPGSLYRQVWFLWIAARGGSVISNDGGLNSCLPPPDFLPWYKPQLPPNLLR